jgi:hypothetical protein
MHEAESAQRARQPLVDLGRGIQMCMSNTAQHPQRFKHGMLMHVQGQSRSGQTLYSCSASVDVWLLRKIKFELASCSHTPPLPHLLQLRLDLIIVLRSLQETDTAAC